MQKLLRLLTVAVGFAFATSSVSAGDVFTVSLNNGDTQSTADFFTVNSGGGYNSKYTGTYGGVTYTKGLKLNTSSSISFTTANTSSTVIIVQSLASNAGNTPKFDKIELDKSVRADDTDNKVGVFTVAGVEAGEHMLSNGGETGVLFVSVEYTGTDVVTLDAPVFTIDAATGTVTLAGTNVHYTTDGSTPTASSEAYSAPFVVEDGTTVSAISVGDGSTTVSSEVVSQEVNRTGITIATPTFVQYNGTVKIESSKNATIEYSFDKEAWTTYTKPFTLTESKTVYARGSREGCTTSEIAEVEVAAIEANTHKSRKLLTYSYTGTSANEVTFADGATLAISSNTDKKWDKGNAIVVDGESLTSLKLSNGAQNTFTLPSPYVATSVRFYSYVNADSGICGWKEVNGVDLQSGYADDYRLIPMGAFRNGDDPDVRIYPLDNVDSFTFTNAGTQLCFVMVVEVYDAAATSVDDVEATQAQEDGVVYDLSGRKVLNPVAGKVYIKNGKKFVVK